MTNGADELTDDAIAGDWRILQRRRGHRYSLDDVATAWEATLARPDARSCLDLGCGIGSVLLMVAYKLPHARVVGLEAQKESFDLAFENVTRNGIAGRTTLWLGDLRDRFALERLPHAPFDLVTGTPPYFAPDAATPSPDPQRAAARVELRGGVEDYLRAAALVLAPGGRFVVCAEARKPERVLTTARDAGLAPLRQRDVIPRAEHKGALFTLWTLGHASEGGSLDVAPPLVARDATGARTAASHSLRHHFDLPTNDLEPPSP